MAERMTKLICTDQDREAGRWCPSCNADWRASQISDEYIKADHYGHDAPCRREGHWDADRNWTWENDCTCPPRFYSRLIGIDLPGYDGVGEWMCPECRTRWSRWTGDEVPAVPDAA